MLMLTAVIIFQVSLELGGNAPCIVFDDADIDVAVKGSVSKFEPHFTAILCVVLAYKPVSLVRMVDELDISCDKFVNNL